VARELDTQLRALPDDAQVLIAIETPVMNRERRNVVTFRKQLSVLHAIQHEIVRQSLGHWMVEINPTQAKLRGVGNGSASKADIIAASPFAGSGKHIEAMADACMIAQAGRKMPGNELIELPIINRFPYTIEEREDVL
jgi:Holliday junction resolvasome RuvABC endonuclease subunit